jgi:hypothetical protein
MKPTSIRFDDATYRLVERMARSEHRSISNMLGVLVIEGAQKRGMMNTYNRSELYEMFAPDANARALANLSDEVLAKQVQELVEGSDEGHSQYDERLPRLASGKIDYARIAALIQEVATEQAKNCNHWVEILIKDEQDATTPDVLAVFPFLPGQYAEPELKENSDGGLLITVQLADHDDLTAAQEQFLNASDQVIEYAVKDDLD